MQIPLILQSFFSVWFDRAHIDRTLGYLIAIVCGLIMITELYTMITQKTEADMFMLLLGGVFGGLIQGLMGDELLSILVALCWLMIYSVWTIRESPVWRELMIASLISYLVILAGRAIMVIVEWHAEFILGYPEPEKVPYLGLTGQQWFGIGWNVFIYVFFFLCLIFFGRRFFLVSRLTSPQIIYLLLFAVSYFILFQLAGKSGERLTLYYPGVPEEVANRLLFASFGTYEIMIITNLLLYFISGPLLHLIFGVKKVSDQRVLGLVEEVKNKLNIRGKVRVGRVKAPILNAFAFGAFFDKRIAFMSKELDDFTDDDIRGIAGHELVHSKRVHTLWLFLITTITFAITKALALPATPLDYIFNPDVGLDFLWYYLYNIALVVFSYLFIRILEGQADKLTMKAGFGKALSKTLIKLDGFYQGVASEMGLSVYLLTDKEQSQAEKVRFLGDAGRNMYNANIKPNNMELFINLMASHPKSAYRVAALTEQEKLPPVKAAMLPLLLLIPFLRKKYLKQLHEARSSIAKVIDQTFIDTYGKKSSIVYDNLSHISYQYNYLKGKDVVAISKIDNKEYHSGKVKEVKVNNTITSLVTLVLESEGKVTEYSISDYTFFEMAINQKQIFKNGKIGIIKEIGSNPKKFAFKAEIFDFENRKETKELTVPGVPISYFDNIVGKDILFLQKGATRLAHLDTIEFSDKGFSEATLTISIGGETKKIKGGRFVVEFKPFDVYLKKGKEDVQRSLVEYLKGKHASFQTKDDLDTLVKGQVKTVKEDSLEVEILNEVKEIKLKRIEFLYIYEETILLIYKPNLSFLENIMMRFGNTRKMNYIIP